MKFSQLYSQSSFGLKSLILLGIVWSIIIFFVSVYLCFELHNELNVPLPFVALLPLIAIWIVVKLYLKVIQLETDTRQQNEENLRKTMELRENILARLKYCEKLDRERILCNIDFVIGEIEE